MTLSRCAMATALRSYAEPSLIPLSHIPAPTHSHARPWRCHPSCPCRTSSHLPAFTLLELLISIAIIALLVSIILPTLSSARSAGQSLVCSSNTRQLAAALDLYATDNTDLFAPAAASFLTNLNRWHGTRATTGHAFTGQGPLSPYFAPSEGTGRSLRACPTFLPTLDTLRDASLGGGAASNAAVGFEHGCGGYAYNSAFVGTDRHPERWITPPATPDPGTPAGSIAPSPRGFSAVRSDQSGSSRARFQSPSTTIAFTDAALAVESPARDLIEYSFAEPRFHPHLQPTLGGAARPDPSIHFRHGPASSAAAAISSRPAASPRATIAWLDAHATSEPLTHSWSSGLYLPDARRLSIGWPGEADDNSLFDYR